jgi:cell division protein FtsW
MVWFAQCFASGLPWRYTLGLGGCALGLGGVIYVIYPHAAYRMQIFMTGQGQDPFGSQYQSIQALKSFASGGLLGRGPGAGVMMNRLPDGHADFVFAVAGEELGAIVCLGIIALYGGLTWRCLRSAWRQHDMFHGLAILGLTFQIALQTVMNMASVLRLMPTKGVTLPFLSYGGSSFLSLCWAMGMVLALSRRYKETS